MQEEIHFPAMVTWYHGAQLETGLSYSWDPPTGLSDPYIANPRAGPTLQLHMYLQPAVQEEAALTRTASLWWHRH
jgi:hypothetical protein